MSTPTTNGASHTGESHTNTSDATSVPRILTEKSEALVQRLADFNTALKEYTDAGNPLFDPKAGQLPIHRPDDWTRATASGTQEGSSAATGIDGAQSTNGK